MIQATSHTKMNSPTIASSPTERDLAVAALLTKRLDGRGRIDAVCFEEGDRYGMIFQIGTRRGTIRAAHPITEGDADMVVRMFADWSRGAPSTSKWTPDIEEADAIPG